MKLLKAVHPRETLCKEMHKQMNLAGAPTRLASPELYMILDVDELQKQVNRLENRVSEWTGQQQEPDGEESHE